jgi:[ribosomal protein S5]-alanine N-acetyltransferase
LHATHTDALLGYYLRNAAHFKPWDPARPASFWEPQSFARTVQGWVQLCESGSAVRFVMRLKAAAEYSVIGTINFSNIVGRPFQACTLGYAMDEAHTGQGLMREGLTAAIAYMQRERAMHRIMANHLPHNHKSAATLAALGFEREGYARDYLQIDGRWQDHVLTALTTAEMPPDLS